MQQVTHNKMVQSKITRDEQLAALGVSPVVAKIALRIADACKEPKQARYFTVINQGNGEWNLIETISGKVEVVK